MKLGACWYPEQHPEARWRDDAERMVDAGLRLVRVGEFAWGALEPTPGGLESDWLAKAIDVATSAGLGVVLGPRPALRPPGMAVAAPA